MILIFILNQTPAGNEIVRTHIVDHFQESDNTQKRPRLPVQGLANLHKQDPFELKDSAGVLRYILGKPNKRSPHLVLCTICIILEASLNGRASSKVAVSQTMRYILVQISMTQLDCFTRFFEFELFC